MEPQFVIDVVIIMAIYDITKNGIKCLFNAWVNSVADNIQLEDFEEDNDK